MANAEYNYTNHYYVWFHANHVIFAGTGTLTYLRSAFLSLHENRSSSTWFTSIYCAGAIQCIITWSYWTRGKLYATSWRTSLLKSLVHCTNLKFLHCVITSQMITSVYMVNVKVKGGLCFWKVWNIDLLIERLFQNKLSASDTTSWNKRMAK